MRRYFYLIILFFSFSVSSQEMNEEIVGKWKVIKVSQSFICFPRTELAEYYLVFTKSGLVYDVSSKVDNKRKASNNSKWSVSDDGLIELTSEIGEIGVKFEFKFMGGNRYGLHSKFIKIVIEKVEA